FIAEEESRIITPQDEKFIEEKIDIDVLKEDIKSTGEINQDEKNNNTDSALIVEKNEMEQQLVKKKTPKSKSEKQAKLKTPKTSRKKKEKTINTNNKKKIILLTSSVLLLGLIVVSIFVFLNKDETYIVEQPNSKELAENNKNIEKTPENTEVNTLETETEIIETKVGDSLPVEPIEKEVVKPIEKKAVKSEIVKQVVVSTSSTHNYHIIGGSFSVEENANRFVEQMKSKGLNAQVLGKIDKLFVVSIGVYSSKIEAEQQSKAQNMKGWIFRK
ncbi:MAG: SPOR domain-containing protein, partial [Flavobacteriia bacterium]|nr:SPOR domain-containing protein [Flavobacteriia bacterium]